jgi:hypothetical protein
MGMPGDAMQMPRYRPGYGEGGSADGGYGLPGDSGGDLATLDPKAYRRDLFCRRVRAYLGSVQLGLQVATDAVGGPLDAKASGSKLPGGKASAKGAAAPAATLTTATPADQKYVDDVRVAVEALIKVIEVPEVELATVEKDLRRTMQPLEAMTKKLGAVAKPADATDDVNPDLPGAPAAGGKAKPRASAPAPGAPAPEGDLPTGDLPTGDLPEAGAPARPAPTPMPATPMPAAAVPTPMPAAAVTPPDPLDAPGAK